MAYMRTSTGKNPDIEFGQWVEFDTCLKRDERNMGRDPLGFLVTRREWADVPIHRLSARDRRGIVAGTRTLSNGKYEYAYHDSDEPPTYTPDTYFEAAIVYVNMRKNPVLVRLDKVRPLEV